MVHQGGVFHQGGIASWEAFLLSLIWGWNTWADLNSVFHFLGPAAMLVAMVPVAKRSCPQSPPTQHT